MTFKVRNIVSSFDVDEKKVEKYISASLSEVQRQDFAERLRFFRKKAGLTQAQLAERADMTSSVIARYEAGKSMPRAKTIERLSAALEISPLLLDRSVSADSPFWENEFDIELLKRHGIRVQALRGGLYKITPQDLPEIVLTSEDCDQFYQLCVDETYTAFSDSMEKFFIASFLRKAYAKYERRNATDQSGNDTPAE